MSVLHLFATACMCCPDVISPYAVLHIHVVIPFTAILIIPLRAAVASAGEEGARAGRGQGLLQRSGPHLRGHAGLLRLLGHTRV